MPDFSFGALGTRKLRYLQIHHKHVAGNAYKYVARLVSPVQNTNWLKLLAMTMFWSPYEEDTILSTTAFSNFTMNAPTCDT